MSEMSRANAFRTVEQMMEAKRIEAESIEARIADIEGEGEGVDASDELTIAYLAKLRRRAENAHLQVVALQIVLGV